MQIDSFVELLMPFAFHNPYWQLWLQEKCQSKLKPSGPSTTCAEHEQKPHISPQKKRPVPQRGKRAINKTHGSRKNIQGTLTVCSATQPLSWPMQVISCSTHTSALASLSTGAFILETSLLCAAYQLFQKATGICNNPGTPCTETANLLQLSGITA